MHSLIANKVEALAEHAPTLLTNAWFLPSVTSLVPDDMQAADEGFLTVTPFTGFLPRINDLMFHHI